MTSTNGHIFDTAEVSRADLADDYYGFKGERGVWQMGLVTSQSILYKSITSTPQFKKWIFSEK